MFKTSAVLFLVAFVQLLLIILLWRLCLSKFYWLICFLGLFLTLTNIADPRYVPQRKFSRNSGYFHGFRVHAFQWAVAFVFFFVYLVIMLGVSVPTWSFELDGVELTVHCDKAWDLTPACSAARWVDVELLGSNHLCEYHLRLFYHHCERHHIR